MDAAEHAARVTPQCLAHDAEWLLEKNAGHEQELVYNLLRQLREMSQMRDDKSDRNNRYWRHREDEFWRVIHERNEYREALRIVKRATRNITVGR